MTDEELLSAIAESSPWQDVNTFNVCRFCDATWTHRDDCLWLQIVRRLRRGDLLRGERVQFDGDVYGHGTWATLDGIMDPALCTCSKQRGSGHHLDCPIHLPWTGRSWDYPDVERLAAR